MGKKKTTLEEIAQQVGTSKITVSRALKGQRGVGENLRQQIRQAASDLGYEHGRLRPDGKRLHLAFLTPKRFYLATDSFYHEIYYHLSFLCEEQDFSLSPYILEKEDEEYGTLPEKVAGCDGIVIGGEVSARVLRSVEQTGIPYVVVDYDPMDAVSDCVIIDNYRIGASLTEYLYKRGYETIGFVGSVCQSSNVADRIFGYRKTLQARSLRTDEHWIVDNYDRETDNYFLDIPLPDPLPEAFVCHCDRAAYYFMERLKSRGVSLPREVAIVSVDNTELASSTSPALTSMNIDKRSFAVQALALLQERRQGRSKPKRVYLDVELVERDSAPDLR